MRRTLLPLPLGFRDYLLERKYDLGSSRRPSWPFILHVLGDPDFPRIETLGDLVEHLRAAAVPAEVERAARAAWKSYSAYKSRHRKAVPEAMPRLAHCREAGA